VTVDSIRERDVTYYCHKNKEKGKSAKELRCVMRVGGRHQELLRIECVAMLVCSGFDEKKSS
jgi:hypothetical protein